MSDAFLVLVSLSLSGSVLALILFAVRAVLKTRLSNTWQYYIWLLVLRRLLPITSQFELGTPKDEVLAAYDFTSIGDNGAGLLPYAVEENLKNYTAAVEYAAGKGPRFYGSFYQTARHALDRSDSVPERRLLDFTFPRKDQYSLPEWRVSALEHYVRSLLDLARKKNSET